MNVILTMLWLMFSSWAGFAISQYFSTGHNYKFAVLGFVVGVFLRFIYVFGDVVGEIFDGIASAID